MIIRFSYEQCDVILFFRLERIIPLIRKVCLARFGEINWYRGICCANRAMLHMFIQFICIFEIINCLVLFFFQISLSMDGTR